MVFTTFNLFIFMGLHWSSITQSFTLLLLFPFGVAKQSFASRTRNSGQPRWLPAQSLRYSLFNSLIKKPGCQKFLIFGNPAILLSIFRVRQPGCLNKTRSFAPIPCRGPKNSGRPPITRSLPLSDFSPYINDN